MMGRPMSAQVCPAPGCDKLLARGSKRGVCYRHGNLRRCRVDLCPFWVTRSCKTGVCQSCARTEKTGRNDPETHKRGWATRRADRG